MSQREGVFGNGIIGAYRELLGRGRVCDGIEETRKDDGFGSRLQGERETLDGTLQLVRKAALSANVKRGSSTRKIS